MVGLNISMKVTLMPLAMAAMFLTIPMTFVQYNNWTGRVELPARLQQIIMMLRVPCHNVCHGAYGNGSPIGDSRALPNLWREGFEQRNRRIADFFEFIEQVAQAARIGMGFAHIIVLFEAMQFLLVSASEAQRAVTLHALGVAQMSDDLLHVPFPRLRTRGGRLVGERTEQLAVRVRLRGQERDHVSIGHASDIVGIEVGVFGAIRTGKHSRKTLPQNEPVRQTGQGRRGRNAWQCPNPALIA